MGTIRQPSVYLDMDGVLADFEQLAGDILQTNNIYKWEFVNGGNSFWDKLSSYPEFFRSLPVRRGARELVRAVRWYSTAILTAIPSSNGEAAREQKSSWVRQHIGASYEVLTCRTKDKPMYCQPGDVLIDDRAINKAEWEKKGGIFILHTETPNTIRELNEAGMKTAPTYQYERSE